MQAWIQNVLLNYVVAHQQLLIGMAVGAVLSHPGTCAVLLFNLFVKIPGVGSWIARNPDAAKAWADQFDQAINTCVDKYAKDNADPVQVPVPAPAADAPPAPKAS